jgi:V-type H+-transporting ATPase subunit d
VYSAAVHSDILYSYIEGIVRGYRNALLTGQNYNNLTQCETIDGRLFQLVGWISQPPES